MNNSTALKKSCIHCGLKKPLASFLQLDVQGTIYGNVCADCRKAIRNKNKAIAEEGSTTSRTGTRIDSKSRVHSETEKKRTQQHTEEANQEELEKVTHEKIEKKEKRQHKAQAERNHRDTYLKKSSFLGENKVDKELALEKKHETETASKKEAIKSDEKKKIIDTTGPYIPSQHAEVKLQGIAFKAFKDWVGKRPGIGFNPQAPQQGEQKQKNTKPDKKLMEHIDKTWKPTNRGR